MFESISRFLISLFEPKRVKADRFEVIVVYSLFLSFIVVNLSGLMSTLYFGRLTDSFCKTIGLIY